MLTEERHSNILSLLDKDGSVTVQQLMKELQTSESTIRRDLNQLDAQGFLTKVHGGAIAKNTIYSTMDENVMNRKAMNAEAKIRIAKYAASLIEPEDFVYLDAGTTTELMIDYITNRQTVFVTNAISHAKKLSDIGFRVYILGGEFKSATEAIVGEEAVETIIEATNGNNEKLIYESSDLLYHLIVLLTSKGLRIEDVVKELQMRHDPEWDKKRRVAKSKGEMK